MIVISLIVMATCLKTTGTKWEIIGTISMVQVNIYPTNGAKSMASGMLLMATVECWPMSGKSITTSKPVVPWQIENGATTKTTLVGFTSNLADATPKNNGLVPTILNLVATWPIRNGFTTQTIKLGTILRTMVCMSQEPMLWMVKTSSSKKMENGFVN